MNKQCIGLKNYETAIIAVFRDTRQQIIAIKRKQQKRMPTTSIIRVLAMRAAINQVIQRGGEKVLL